MGTLQTISSEGVVAVFFVRQRASRSQRRRVEGGLPSSGRCVVVHVRENYRNGQKGYVRWLDHDGVITAIWLKRNWFHVGDILEVEDGWLGHGDHHDENVVMVDRGRVSRVRRGHRF